MTMITEQGFARVRGVLRRRRLPVVMVTAVVLGLGVMLIGLTKPRYRASAVVRALESQPAREYVPPTTVEQMGERLRTLRMSLMARPLIAGVVDELHLLPPGKGNEDKEKLIQEMRGRMDVKVEGEDTFLVVYDDPDPARAALVVNALARRFIDGQVALRKRVAEATLRAFVDEAKSLRPHLDELERKVREFKQAHYGSLPEQQEQNLRQLDQATMELNIQSTNLDLQNERRRQLITAAISPLRQQEEQLLTTLHDARTRYLPDHPEVRRIEAEYNKTRAARLEEEHNQRRKLEVASPELIALDNEIRHTRALIAGLRQRQVELQTRVADTTHNGQALARLVADYEATRVKLEGIESRRREAELAVGLEERLKGLRYELVEGALRPTSPVAPNRPVLLLGVLVLALGLGLGLGFTLDRMDSRIYAPAELASLERPLPLLACIPRFEGSERS